MNLPYDAIGHAELFSDLISRSGGPQEQLQKLATQKLTPEWSLLHVCPLQMTLIGPTLTSLVRLLVCPPPGGSKC